MIMINKKPIVLKIKLSIVPNEDAVEQKYVYYINDKRQRHLKIYCSASFCKVKKKSKNR